ncbi:MAG: hypothetical protein LBQ60_21000 [Bacteroidales bacterium]|jgi:MFS family permease|nr:hypothetical protein [Bacteroidales bacterium]
MNYKEINLREIRDFGEKFNAVFSFVQLNFKSLFKIILFTVGPLILLGSIMFGMLYSNAIDVMSLDLDEGLTTLNSAFEGIFANLLLGLASLWMMIAIYAYMAEYAGGNRNISIETIWNRGKTYILPIIGFGIVFFIVLILAMVIIVAIPIPQNMMFFKVLLASILLFYIFIAVSLTFPIMIIEKKPLIESINRSFFLIRSNWWATFWLLLVMGLVVGIASVVFAIPFYVSMGVAAIMQIGETGNLLIIICSLILFLGSYLMSVLPTLALGFQYFNLVEKKEGTGLLEKIEQLGKEETSENEGGF